MWRNYRWPTRVRHVIYYMVTFGYRVPCPVWLFGLLIVYRDEITQDRHWLLKDDE